MRVKKIGILSSAFLLSGLWGVLPVWADMGSIAITSDSTESVSITKVADTIDGKFELCAPFQRAKIDLNNLQNASEISDAAETLLSFHTDAAETRLSSQEDAVSCVLNPGGTAFDNLSAGVYLLFDSDATDETQIMPSLIQIPLQDEKSGEMIYEITVTPKYTQVSEPVNQEAGNPQTGDGSRIVLYTALILGSLVVLFLLALALFLPNFGL